MRREKGRIPPQAQEFRAIPPHSQRTAEPRAQLVQEGIDVRALANESTNLAN